VEYYCTIFAAAESVLEAGVLWTGSDDGRVHISKDHGATWQDVSPKGLPEFTQINSMEADPFNPGGLYLAGTRYKWGDFSPYLYHTKDYGKTWQRIDAGIDRKHFTRVIRTDPNKEGLLFAGTEYGLYLSVDGGKKWQVFQNNLPLTPITDLAVKDRHLVAATQGRSFWILDDLSPLYEMEAGFNEDSYLYQAKPTYLMQAGYGGKSKSAGENHPNGLIIHYYLAEIDSSIDYQLRILNEGGEVVRKFSSQSKKPSEKWEPKMGAHRFIWNLRSPGFEAIDGMILWYVLRQGPYALPGNYTAQLIASEDTMAMQFPIILDPRLDISKTDLAAQHAFMNRIIAGMDSMNNCIREIRSLRAELNRLKGRIQDTALSSQIDEVLDRAKAIEESLYQTKNRSPQDPLNFPIRLNNKYGHVGALASIGFQAPTAAMISVEKELWERIEADLKSWAELQIEVKGISQELKNSDFEILAW